MSVDGSDVTPEFEFDLMCCECGKDIRLTREIQVNGKAVAFYADELGLESTEFHFHVPR